MDAEFEDAITEGTKAGDWLVLAGLRALSVAVDFAYGEGGESLSVILQTSLDGGRSGIDIAHFRFAREGCRQIATLTGLSGLAPHVPQRLAPGEILDGFLGDRIRFVRIATGDYKNSSIADHGAAR